MNMIETAKTYLLIFLCVVLVAGGLYHWGEVTALKATISTLNKKINDLQIAFDTAVDANKKLEEAIGVQNKSIEAMQEEAKRRQAAAAAALAKAREESGKWKKKYDELLMQPPQNPDDQAGSLNLRLDQYLTKRQEEIAK